MNESEQHRQKVEGWSFFNEGPICEQYPERNWPYDDCIGPGMPRASRGPKEFAHAARGMETAETS